MLKEAVNNTVDVLETFKIYMLYHQSITNDKIFQAIMETLKIVESDVNFEEAIQDNKSRILKANNSTTGVKWNASNK